VRNDVKPRTGEVLELPLPRVRCWKCRKAIVCCYCKNLAPFKSSPRFVILIHPLEARHPIGTGRMAHQSLLNSHLWEGSSFENFEPLIALLADPKIYPVLLFPGDTSTNLSTLSAGQRLEFFPAGREVVIIVLDATWHLAKKMLHRTSILQKIPRISFTPPGLSGFIIRKQPEPYCYSTIEAIHEILRLMNPTQGHEAKPDESPASLLNVFHKMVAQQLAFREARPEGRSRHARNYLIRKNREDLIKNTCPDGP
jgi:DTW domain-containing protein YfiP